MSQEEHFKFVKSLAIELNRKDITLSSFPDVVVRIRQALDDPDTTAEKIADILSVDPALASRVLILANSSHHNPGGIKVEGLNAAVGRIGLRELRTAAISYAVEQLHASENLKALKSELRDNWSGAMRLAAMSEVIARHCTRLDPDSAFVAGLLNQIGVLYIFSKCQEYPSLVHDPDTRQNLIDEWAAPIGECIVGNWDFSKEIQATLNPDDVENTRRGTEADLVDVVIAAKASLNGAGDQVTETKEAKRLHLTEEKMPAIHEALQQRLGALATAVR